MLLVAKTDLMMWLTHGLLKYIDRTPPLTIMFTGTGCIGRETAEKPDEQLTADSI